MPTPYHPPFTITPRQLTLVGEISERIGREEKCKIDKNVVEILSFYEIPHQCHN